METWQCTAEDMARDPRPKRVIDLRSPAFFDKQTWPGAENRPWEELEGRLDTLPTDLPLYLFCYKGLTSDEFAEELAGQGAEVYSIEDGWYGCLRCLLSQN